MNNLQIDNWDTLVDPYYRHKICNLKIVCSITMLWLWKHIFPDILNTLEHPLVALSTVRTILLLPKHYLLFIFFFCWYFSLVLLLHSVTRLDGFSLLHPILCQRCFCWQRTHFRYLTSRNWILNKKTWINILTSTLWKSIKRSWKKIGHVSPLSFLNWK